MYSQILEEIGLSPNEAKIYETLISTGEASVSDIAVKAQVHRRNIYDALNRLSQKGLVFPIFQKSENKYQAVHPDKLLEVVKEKENRLKAILPELNKKFATDIPEDAAYIYRGPEGFKSYVRDVMRLKENAYSIGAKGLLYSLSPELSRELWNSVKQKNLDVYTLYDPHTVELMPQVVRSEGGKKRVLPKEYHTSGVLDIFGDRVVTFANVDVGKIYDETTIFVMVNKALADSYKTWFRFIWEKSLDLE